MENNAYYSAEELAEMNGVSKRIIGEVTSGITDTVTCFAKKVGSRRTYSDDERHIVKFVFDNEGDLTRAGAIRKALHLFYRIDTKRAN